MEIRAELDRVHGDVAACEAAVLGDLVSGTVLYAAADPGFLQERYDALLARAVRLLSWDPGEASGRLPSRVLEPAIQEAVWMTATATQVFLSAPGAEDEAICCQCRPEVDVAALSSALRTLLGAPS